MTLHLLEFSVNVAPSTHAIVILRQAGSHLSKALMPDNITRLPLPPNSPGLNPVEKLLVLIGYACTVFHLSHNNQGVSYTSLAMPILRRARLSPMVLTKSPLRSL